ncbi:scavenger mRNA-decapping enzyme DcpS [Pseudohyphozyma bogoriensis]|nr:scavenger mRNA-decapping enzyme DcpS [Pseudohyphozyma bogoriensis]
MSPPSASTSAASFTSASALLGSWTYSRVLSEDTRAGVVYLLGTAIPAGTSEPQTAIIKIEQTPYDLAELPTLKDEKTWDRLETKTTNDIYGTFLGWYAPGKKSADIQLSSICPATDKHIKKYSQQNSRLVRETPALYRSVVEPYINSLSPKQINWVYQILDGVSEAENVIYRDEDPETGFVLTPDLKWDQTNMSSLYLLVLTQSRSIKSMRDLRPSHLPLLKKIRKEAERAAIAKYGIDKGELRMFVHYQPTYYHFHVHVTHLNYVGFPGITVGQAHLLDDIIDNLELDAASESSFTPTYYERRTLTYALGTEHPLFPVLKDAEAVVQP